MDPGLLAGSGTALGQIVIVAVSLISTIAMLVKTSRDQQHALDMFKLQHDVDAADRREKAAIDRAEREAAASAIRERLVTDASAVQAQMHANANRTQDRLELQAVAVQEKLTQQAVIVQEKLDHAVVDVRTEATTALDRQTETIVKAVDEAKTSVATEAHAAYSEANAVNIKIRDLHASHEAHGQILQQQGRMLEELLAFIQKRPHDQRAGDVKGPVAVPVPA